MKLSSSDLHGRLKKKGIRDIDYTKKLIIEKLNDDDCEVATTSLKVSLSCPLGKMRMQVNIQNNPTLLMIACFYMKLHSSLFKFEQPNTA